jgi:hypothetical protein
VSKNQLLLRFAQVGPTVWHLLHHVLTVQPALIAQKVPLLLLSVIVDSMQGHKPQFVHSARLDTTAPQIQLCLLYVQLALILLFNHLAAPSVMQEISV